MAHQQRIVDFLQEQRTQFPELAEAYDRFGDLHSRKLWHQLSEDVVAFVEDGRNARGVNFVQLYNTFVKDFAHRINKLTHARIIVSCTRQICSDPSSGLAAACAMLEELMGVGIASATYKAPPAPAPAMDEEADARVEGAAEESKGGEAAAAAAAAPAAAEDPVKRSAERKRESFGDAPFLLAHAEYASYKLRQGSVTLAKELLEEARQILDKLEGASPLVHSAVYRASAELHKSQGPADAFYRDALQYTAYTALDTLPTDARRALAVDVSVAALSSATVYNFGELLATPVLAPLAGTPDAWLADLMHAVNSGHIDRFNIIVSEHAASIQQQPVLAASLERVKQKVTLLALVELVFQRPANARCLSFAEIAEATRLQPANVEWLLMRAMALKLVQGKIDQVEQVVRVTFVQPRVLSREQVASLRDKLATWRDTVHQTHNTVKDGAHELFQ